MTSSLNIAIIGCGGIARSHAEATRQVGDARLVATADIDVARAELLASEYGAPRAYECYQDALDDPLVDAVVVCLPPHLHVEAVIAAAGAGKHILCEKPLATTLPDVDGMIAAAHMAGVVLMVGQVLRFREANILARELLAQGRIGSPRHLVRRRYHRMLAYPSAPWSVDPERAGGWVLYGFGSHEIDMMLWLLDTQIREVYARGARTNPVWGDYDDIAIQMWLADDVAATLNLSLNCHTDAWDTVITGEEGSMLVTGEEVVVNGDVCPAPMNPSGGFVPQLAEFVSAVAAGREPQASGANVRRTMVALEAAKMSLGAGGVIRPEDLRSPSRFD